MRGAHLQSRFEPDAGHTAFTAACDARLTPHHTENLNTPRLVADDTQKTVWKWEQQEPFGAGACSPDPDGDNVQFEFNLRFPGQYFDRESNQHYNYFRDYEPGLGRYVQSDPIGLGGGLNTFAYVKLSPLRLIDPRGLRVERCCRSARIVGGKVNHCWPKTDTKSVGMNSTAECRVAGNDYEPPYVTPVVVSDHSCDTADTCQVIDDIDEDCVNKETAFGQTLGKFDLAFNNCRTYANSIIEKCSTKKIPRTPYFGKGGR